MGMSGTTFLKYLWHLLITDLRFLEWLSIVSGARHKPKPVHTSARATSVHIQNLLLLLVSYHLVVGSKLNEERTSSARDVNRGAVEVGAASAHCGVHLVQIWVVHHTDCHLNEKMNICFNEYTLKKLIL